MGPTSFVQRAREVRLGREVARAAQRGDRRKVRDPELVALLVRRAGADLNAQRVRAVSLGRRLALCGCAPGRAGGWAGMTCAITVTRPAGTLLRSAQKRSLPSRGNGA